MDNISYPFNSVMLVNCRHVVAVDADVTLFMVVLCNRADHYIFALWFLLLSFFPRLISAVVDWMSTVLRHMVWPYSVNV